MLGQLAAAASGTVTSWSDQTDEVMIAQGEASARVGQFISARVVPSCDGLAERLSGGGAILDVGTGIGALATALAEAFPVRR
jgi:methylase of polypeptide subunit release factors